MAAVRTCLTFLLLTIALPKGVEAQSISYQRLPIGDRAMGMGGAYTGLAEDLSAVWYNPGGLISLDRSSVSGALSINLFDNFVIEDGYGFGDEAVDLEDSGSVSIPVFVGGMGKIGDRSDPLGQRHALAASAVNPLSYRRRFLATIPPTATGTSAALDVSSRNRVQHYGPTYAYRLSEHLGIGVSLYLSIHDLEYDEAEIFTTGTRQPDGRFTTESVRARIAHADASVYSLLPRFGLLWAPYDDFQLGVMMQLPNLPLSRRGEISDYVTGVDTMGTGELAGVRQETTPEIRQPFELRLGVAYAPLPNWRLAFDFSFYGPLGREDDPLYVFGETTPDPVTGVEPIPGRFISNALWARPSFNVALGMETVIADIMPVSFGAYSDLSPTRRIDTPGTTYRGPSMNSVGITGVIGIRSGGYNVAVGGALVLGWGTAYASNPDNSSPDPYVPKDASSTSLFIFFTGYAQAAERLAADVETFRMTEEERERRDREEAERGRLEELRRQCEERLARELSTGAEDEAENGSPSGD